MPDAGSEPKAPEHAAETRAFGRSLQARTGRGKGWERLLLAVLSTVGMVLSCPDYDVWWLGFVAWVPLYAAIDGLPPGRALFYGWVTGCLTVFTGFFWLTELLTKFADFPLVASSPIAFLFASWHGLLWGFAAMITAFLVRRTTVPLIVAAPLAWVAVEATLPNIFPIYMAHAWSWQPLWIQTAELGGVTTVSFTMVAINAGLYTLVHTARTRGAIDRVAAIGTASLLVGVPLYGAIRIAQVEAAMERAPKLDVGVVQGNMSISEMADPRNKLQILDKHRRMSAALAAQGADLVLWGETAYPNGRVFHRASDHEPPPDHPWRIHVGFEVPALVGVVTRDARGGSPYPWNTALLFDGQGNIRGRYDKVYRLIFGEYIPLVDPEWYLQQVPSASHLDKGDGPHALELETPEGTYRLGPFICYEDILPRYVRSTAAQGVHVFVNLTNDSWFGKTHEPGQHLGLAVFRAVEHRKALVRAVNTGVSAYVDPTGRARVKTRVTDPDIDGPQDAEGFVARVPMMDPRGRTLYGWTGELFDGLCVLGVVLVAVRWPRRRE